MTDAVAPAHLVADASAIVALLTDSSDRARWLEQLVGLATIHAPHHVLPEVANALRRLARAQLIDEAQATAAHDDLVSLNMQLYPYAPLSQRIWSLRHHLTAYDACYVALAESLDATLVTLDAAIVKAPGLRCDVLAPGGLTGPGPAACPP